MNKPTFAKSYKFVNCIQSKLFNQRMLKLIVVICVVFCLQDILAAPSHIKKGLNEKLSNNATMTARTALSEFLKHNLLDEKNTLKTKRSNLPQIQSDTQGCINQNIQTEVVNLLRDLSNVNIQIFDDVTNDMVNRRNQLVDRINSEKFFFFSTISACTSTGIAVDACLNTAVH